MTWNRRQAQQVTSVVSFTVLGGFALSLLSLPARSMSLMLFGSELTLAFSGLAQLGALLAGLLVAGVWLIGLYANDEGRYRLARLPRDASLPLLLLVVMLGWLPRLPGVGYRLGFCLFMGVLLAWAIQLQHDPRGNPSSPTFGALVKSLLIYALTFSLYYLIYEARVRSILSATGVMLISELAALALFGGADGEHMWRGWLYAVIAGLGMGQLTWGLNYIQVASARIGAGFLLACFYSLTGLADDHLRSNLSPRAVLEYVMIAVACLIASLALT